MFRVYDLRFRVYGLRFRVSDLHTEMKEDKDLWIFCY